MKIEVKKEELEFIMHFCKRFIKFSSQHKCDTTFDLKIRENIATATILYNKIERAYEIECMTENESVRR